jgi:hypothetical protein
MTLLVATSPSALIAITGKGNVCEKPGQVRYGLSTTIGHGLVTAEGEEHKVCLDFPSTTPLIMGRRDNARC